MPSMDEPPYVKSHHVCPHCDELREASEFEFVKLVPELGNLAQFRCLHCGKTFEELPPDPTARDFMGLN
jgi:hypothetical protein